MKLICKNGNFEPKISDREIAVGRRSIRITRVSQSGKHANVQKKKTLKMGLVGFDLMKVVSSMEIA